MSSEFHFSPRANRAGEIAWRHWDAEAFRVAVAEDKPVLLAISAVWCHWCHVMDETSYSEGDVISYINEHFIPVRVDNDQRPDVNARYNMGGWPTTAVLTPDGTTITGATYVPPAQMLRMLREIEAFYRENKVQIAERVVQLKSRKASAEETGTSGDLRASMIARVVEQLSESFDDEFGGFGVEPKFPQTDALELLLLEYRVGGEKRLHEMVAKTMLAMSRGGMYDHVEGGFFRYSTTRDWSVPHFEKMGEDHAGLLRVLAVLVLIGKNPDFHATLRSATNYVVTVLRDEKTALFAGSQDADEAYFALPLDQRRTIAAPYVDRTAYSNWSAGLASAFFAVGAVLDDDRITRYAVDALESLHERMLDSDGLLYHFLPPAGSPQVRGLLTDQAAYLRALLDAHEHTGEHRFLTRAVALVDAMQSRLADAHAGFYDHASLQGELGNLSFKDRPLHENALVADSLLRLSALTDVERYRHVAETILSIYSKTYGKAGSFASSYVRALRRLLAPVSTVTVHGDPASTQAFRETARRLPDPLLSIRTKPGSPQPSALICRDTVCGAPVPDPAQLRAAFDSMVTNF